MTNPNENPQILMWLDSIKDNELHHIGECYSFIFHRPWRTPGRHLKKEFMDWYTTTFFQESSVIFNPSGFETLRDMDCTFFIRRKP